MNYHAEEPENVERVELDHLKDSFVKYVRHDSLGQIANTYLANADPYGPMDIRCIELAQLHSRAVGKKKKKKKRGGDKIMTQTNLYNNTQEHA
jgi:RNA-dependent RNA polymerase